MTLAIIIFILIIEELIRIDRFNIYVLNAPTNADGKYLNIAKSYNNLKFGQFWNFEKMVVY